MDTKDKQELEQILEVMAPVFGQVMYKAVLDALRQHDEEQAVQVTCDVQEPKINFAQLAKDVHLQPLGVKPAQEELLSLVGEFDADKWAQLYVRSNPPQDQDTMRGWFANAIMAGYDHKAKEIRKKLESMQNCLDVQGSQGNWDADHYMHGMFNGMEHMMAIMEDREPQFRSWPKVSNGIGDGGEVKGEREVWAKAYAAMQGHGDAASYANTAVKAFRERYK